MIPTSETVERFVSARITGAMKLRNVNQSGLAAELGLSQQQVQQRLSGQTRWPLAEVVQAALILDVPIRELIPNEIVEARP